MSYAHLTRLIFLRNLLVIVYSNVSSGSHPKLCALWNLNIQLVHHIVWISMHKTCNTTWTHYPDSDATSICSFSLCSVFSRETRNTNCIVFGLTPSRPELTIYHTQGEHANNYTTDVGFIIKMYSKSLWWILKHDGQEE